MEAQEQSGRRRPGDRRRLDDPRRPRLGVFLLMVASLLTLPGRRKPLLFSGLALAILTFSVLAIGQNVVGEHEGVAQLFVYARSTATLLALLLAMPPYSRPDWLSGRGCPD